MCFAGVACLRHDLTQISWFKKIWKCWVCAKHTRGLYTKLQISNKKPLYVKQDICCWTTTQANLPKTSHRPGRLRRDYDVIIAFELDGVVARGQALLRKLFWEAGRIASGHCNKLHTPQLNPPSPHLYCVWFDAQQCLHTQKIATSVFTRRVFCHRQTVKSRIAVSTVFTHNKTAC